MVRKYGFIQSFNPELGHVINENGEIMSPALGLTHEMGHIKDASEGSLNDWEVSATDYPITSVSSDLNYDNPGEKSATVNYEHPIARRLGEPIRFHHTGEAVRVYGPASRTATNAQDLDSATKKLSNFLNFRKGLLDLNRRNNGQQK